MIKIPYIKPEDRKCFNEVIDGLAFENKGELEYVVFKLMKQYMATRQQRYSTLHDCTYAVQHCSDEFRRRYLDKRENDARESNGDIL